MNPDYPIIMDSTGSAWMLLAYGLHLVAVVAHSGLAIFLVLSGARQLVSPGHRQIAPQRLALGTSSIGLSQPRLQGGFRISLGLLLVGPLLLEVHFGTSLFAAVSALALLVTLERGIPSAERRPGLLARRTAMAFAVIASLFMIWEREDNLELGFDLLLNAAEWRGEEIAWQKASDARSPKAGDLAPDFELQDPSGSTQVRLSDFRGVRPVALIFGSYT